MTSLDASASSVQSCDALSSENILEKIAVEIDLIFQIANMLDHRFGEALEELPEFATQANAVQDLDLLTQSLGDIKRVLWLLVKKNAFSQNSLSSADLTKAVKLEAIRERLSGRTIRPAEGSRNAKSGGCVELF